MKTIINVAKRNPDANPKRSGFQAPYLHHFRIIKDDDSAEYLRDLIREVMQHYPAPGYSVSVSEWRETGRDVNLTELFK